MKDKNKLIIVAEVAVKGMRKLEAVDAVHCVYERLLEQFDDTVKVVVVPESSKEVPNVTIKSVNSELISPEELDTLIARAEKCIQELVKGSAEH